MTPNMAESFHQPSVACCKSSLTSGSEDSPGLSGVITVDMDTSLSFS